MKRIDFRASLTLLLLFILTDITGCGTFSSNVQTETVIVKKSPGMPANMERSKKFERFIIAGQPNEEECKGLASIGVTYVCNVRGYDEMNNRALVHFDEDSLLRTLNIPYKQMPVSGAAYPYRPALLDTLDRIHKSTEGFILLHCTSGGRAAMVHAGYQVKFRNVSPLEAMRNLESYGMWPLPIEKLTGIPMNLDRADKKE